MSGPALSLPKASLPMSAPLRAAVDLSWVLTDISQGGAKDHQLVVGDGARCRCTEHRHPSPGM